MFCVIWNLYWVKSHTVNQSYQNYLIRDWQPSDREMVANLIKTVLSEYGLPWQPMEADRDVLEVERFYLATGGEFWVVEDSGQIMGSAAYLPISRGLNAVEIRKMYLLPQIRGRGLGKFLLKLLEQKIANFGYQQIWIETASVLIEAVNLYEHSGYQSASGVETKRCDQVYIKSLS